MGDAVGLVPKGLFRAGHSCPIALFPRAFPYRKSIQSTELHKVQTLVYQWELTAGLCDCSFLCAVRELLTNSRKERVFPPWCFEMVWYGPLSRARYSGGSRSKS